MSGGSGDDFVRTDEGIDVVDGGPGADDIATAGADDTIVVKESMWQSSAVKDTVKCGFDDDNVIADLKDDVDAISNVGGGTCEEVDRSPVGETPLVRILGKTLRVFPNGEVRVRMRCPEASRGSAARAGSELRVGRAARSSRSRRVRYRIKAGRRKTVTLHLTRGDVRALRRQKRRKVKSRGVLVRSEKGRKGPKTTIRNPRLRLR